MDNSIYSVKNHVINSDVTHGGRTLVVQNIRYPQFTAKAENSIQSRLALIMNRFYRGGALKYSSYASGKLAVKAERSVARGSKPFGAVMNCSVAFCDESYVSVIVDLSGFNGTDSVGQRVSQTWSIDKMSTVPYSHFFKSDFTSKAFIKDKIVELARVHMSDPAFGYYGDCEKLIRKNFSTENFYLVPNGAAFYYDEGTLCDAKFGPSVFVLPFDRIDGVVKVTSSAG